MSDQETVWNVMFVRKGCGRVSRIPAPPPSGCWTSLMPRAPLLSAASADLFVDGWSGDNKRCRIVEYTTGPGNTRATGSKFYVGWKRPGRGERLADSLNLALFRSVKASDIEQGAVGDCWFMSAMAAVAERPEYITRLFDQKELNHRGKYVVRLWSLLEERWKAYEIDDRLPVLDYDSPAGLSLAYAKTSSDDELWPCLLEKAMAKHMGGYLAMDGGKSIFALGTLLGCPRRKLVNACRCNNGDWNLWRMRWSDDHASDPQYLTSERFPPGEFLDLLSTSRSSDFVMCAGTVGAMSNPADVGLSGQHVYSILDVRRNVAGSGFDLLRIRDPCSYGLSSGYTGDWSMKSSLWEKHPHVAHELLSDAQSPDSEQDEPWASFWMSWPDVSKYFGTIDMAAPNLYGPDQAMEDIAAGRTTETGGPVIGARVHVNKNGTWYQGYIKGLGNAGVDGEGPWAVQCDADPPGTLVETGDITTWVEPGGSYFMTDSDFVVERQRHDIATAMALVLKNSDAIGFNFHFEVGSRVECK
eukprot:TRINITY_DN21574_c0_g1_i2.p1 TRINITY_DN21574_c0_g1~~TRINITY_DN21574_c0_g1_i2.p1  ORF type:complete len:527 (-),score=67.18 TRINITY_DN21574_c0_g1_i2:124-1704(-)